MTLKQRLDKKRLIKHLMRELEFIWRYDWVQWLGATCYDNEKCRQKYCEAQENVKQIKSILVKKYGKDYIL